MRNRFYLGVLFVSGMVLLIFALLAAYREMTPEWKRYQLEYKKMVFSKAKDDATREKAKALPVEVQQQYLASLHRVDRCASCHLGVENPLMENAKLPFKQHSGDYLKNHQPDKFGCTICHYGQGRATNKREAHGAGETHWDFPVIPMKYIQSSCAHCHDLGMLSSKGGEKVVKGEFLFRSKGCRGCHKISNVGGVLGKALDDVGSKPVAYFPMRYVEGEKTIYAWMNQHFIDPRHIVPESEMKIEITSEEADFLTTYVLSLRAEEAHKYYRRIREFQPADVAVDKGEALYKMYCIACHTTGKESIFDEIFNRTIPAIFNPDFLKTVDDKLMRKIIEEGRAGTQMTAWKSSAAGLTEDEIGKIIEYMIKNRPKDRPEPFGFARYTTDLKRGEELYKERCALCHGEKGEGELGLNLRNPVVRDADPEFLAITVRSGREGTPMPRFGKNGVGFRDQDIADVVSYVKTLSKKK